jgi:hypothetical protein
MQGDTGDMQAQTLQTQNPYRDQFGYNMPTIRQYFFWSVKNIVLLLLVSALLIASTFLLAWFFPNKSVNNALFSLLFFTKEIGFAFLVSFILFFVHKAYKVSCAEPSFFRELLKMMPAIAIWMVVGLFASNGLYELADETDCRQFNYNEKLNGGPKEVGGRMYAINICGSGTSNGRFLGGSMDTVQLTVSNEQGDVLVKRRYKIAWGSNAGHQPLVVENNRIAYQDDETQEEHTIAMPPNVLEWVGSKFPLLSPY